jgi:taspase (threonine aspartase 1)
MEIVTAPAFFVAVHAGAGYHAPSSHANIQALLCAALQTGVEVLRGGTPAARALDCARGAIDDRAQPGLMALVAVMTALEASPLTNAGVGSALTECGRVEVDACVSACRFPQPAEPTTAVRSWSAGVGAVPGLAHPTNVAVRLLVESTARPDTARIFRIPPSLLVGDGAVTWARSRGVWPATPTSLVTDVTRAQWQRYSAALAAEAQEIALPSAAADASSSVASASASATASAPVVTDSSHAARLAPTHTSTASSSGPLKAKEEDASHQQGPSKRLKPNARPDNDADTLRPTGTLLSLFFLSLDRSITCHGVCLST